jgi:hypothetical protein
LSEGRTSHEISEVAFAAVSAFLLAAASNAKLPMTGGGSGALQLPQF